MLQESQSQKRLAHLWHREAEAKKAEVSKNAEKLAELEELEKEYQEKVKERMMVIPNIIDPSVPIGKDDSENVEIEKFGEPVVPDFEVPYHTEIMEKFYGRYCETSFGSYILCKRFYD